MTASIFTTVRTQFLADFAILRPTVPIAVDGHDFDPKTDGADANGRQIPYVWIGLFPADKSSAAVGSKELRNEGFVWIICRTIQGTGPTLAWEIARDAGSVFENKTFNGVRFRAARPERNGRDEDYYRVDVLIDYRGDEITT